MTRVGVASMWLLLVCAPLLGAAEPATLGSQEDGLSEMTQGLILYARESMLNGDDWLAMGEEAKEAYLLGHEDGVMNTALRNMREDAQRTDALSQLPTAMGPVDLEVVMEEIDAFYAEVRHVGIPIPFALVVIARQRQFAEQGATPERRRRFQAWAELLPQVFPPASDPAPEQARRQDAL